MKSLFFVSVFFYSLSSFGNSCPIEVSSLNLSSKSLRKISEALEAKNYEVVSKADLRLIIFNFGWDQFDPFEMDVDARLYNKTTKEKLELSSTYHSSNLQQFFYLDTNQSMKRKAVLEAIKKIPNCESKSEICFKSDNEKYDYAQKWADTYGDIMGSNAPKKGITGFSGNVEPGINGCPVIEIQVNLEEDLFTVKSYIQSIRQEKDLRFKYEIAGSARAN